MTHVVQTARPRQWIKNILVFAAPGAARVLTHGGVLLHALGAFLLFCLAASGTYFINDVCDAEADRRHPDKSRRPVAAGLLASSSAIVIGVIAIVLAIVLSAALSGNKLVTVIAVYSGVSVSYSLWLKRQPILDLAAVASGFVLRAIAGGVATGVPLSIWFLIVASSGSLLMVSGKRHAESLMLGEERGEHRTTLGEYSLAFLRYVRSVSSSVAITAYFLWAFEKAGGASPLGPLNAHTRPAPHGALWFELSIIPFALGILRYAMLLDAGEGGAPEDVVLGDRALQVLGLALVLLFAVGMYV